MTVICTIITRDYTAHPWDSRIAVPNPDGGYDVVEYEKTKIVRVEHWGGAMSCWGLATHDEHANNAEWSTLKWLEARAGKPSSSPSPEDFAKSLAIDLGSALSKRHFIKPTDRGLGIHFSAYEHVDGCWIPELFAIKNWTDDPAIRRAG